jgi:hypothetical protein
MPAMALDISGVILMILADRENVSPAKALEPKAVMKMF